MSKINDMETLNELIAAVIKRTDISNTAHLVFIEQIDNTFEIVFTDDIGDNYYIDKKYCTNKETVLKRLEFEYEYMELF